MQKKDFLIVALAPLAVLLIPLIGNAVSPEWKWTWHDFLFGWVILATTTFVYRLIVTRKIANLTYKLGAALAVAAGFLITWTTAAVQIIGAENPGNAFYLAVIVTGLAGVGIARFKPAGMARAAFATAAVNFLVPVIAVIYWPGDFSPGVEKVFLINSFFVLMFVVSGLLFRHAATHTGATPATATA